MSNDDEISFKEMCARFDVTPRTLRYYEYIELLSPRKTGRTRSYGPREIARMTLILKGRHFGFSLEDIRQWLDVYGKQGTREQNEQLVQRADAQLEILDKQIEDLVAAREDLKKLRDETKAQL